MAGSGRPRGNNLRQYEPASTGSTFHIEQPVSMIPTGQNPMGGFDGPSDAQSQTSLPAHGFGLALGYDPARDNIGPQKPQFSTLFELPSDAFRDPKIEYYFPKDLPLRPKDLNSQGKPIQVRVNQYKVVQWPQKTVYQYDVHIGKGDEKRGLLRAVWYSRALQAKLRQVDLMWLWDGNKIAWCASRAPREELRMEIDMDLERERAPRIDRATGQPRRDTIMVRIKMVGEIRMAVIQGYLEKKMAFDNTILEAINFLDHCMRQMPSEAYTQIKRSFFARGVHREPLDNVLESMKGVYSSMRLCQPIGSSGNSTGLAVNVDVANGTFWIPQNLHQAARNFCKDRNRQSSYVVFRDLLKPVRQADGSWTWSRDFKELRKMIKLKFQVKHRGKEALGKTYTIKEFVFNQKYGEFGGHAKAVKFPLRDKNNPNSEPTEISVYDYFVKQYNIRLEHWYLPVVLTDKDGTFPMEVCTIVSHQPYKFKLDPVQTAAMIKFCVTRPQKRIESINTGVSMLKWHDDPYLNHYGIKIEPRMTITNARLLKNPEIQFSGTTKVNPGTTGRWDLRGKKFFKNNPVKLKSWGVAILDECIDLPAVNNFLKVFISAYAGHGGVVENKNPLIKKFPKNYEISKLCTEIRQGAGDQSRLEPQILLYVLPDKSGVVYERLKKNMDCRYGLVSQMMQRAHVEKAQPQYCSNVCMKLNAKLGGTTARVAGANPTTPAPFFRGPTMIIGADVSHPSPGSIQGSMAAMTMSMDKDACRYAAAVQTNGHRVEMITTANIRSMMMPLFNGWVKNIGGNNVPQHIYYFRDGVSEGQYVHVLEQEVKDMKKVIMEQYPRQAAGIKFTVTVASKRHHLRFFPKEGDFNSADKNGNSLPGTLVERDVTHPFEYDFYLCSHSAIQGTARPTHYHVIMDEAGVPTNHFQAMIYQHCYQYMRSTTPVSLYPAIYYAHLASLRARAHEDAASSGIARGGGKFMEQQQDIAIRAGILGIPYTGPGRSLSIRPTEIGPLLELGCFANEPTKTNIKFSMWFI